ncbi:MAG TPA: phosphopyruvate hydratase [Candidatus Paceibacterota bacterium]|nr:phosphopyruvate hydratase [Candidatus Paceibacterota bacterium]HPT17859.1 phosphopyruvate hydratase [Candidatus Paceibacterota bacterium]
MDNQITKILAEEIKDSRGNPTLKVTVWARTFVDLDNSEQDVFDSFSVPSGASTGAHEAHELRDENGGVQNAVEIVNKIIAPALIGKDVLNQKEIDRIMIELDGTSNKDNLGGNSIIGVSIACAKVAAKASDIEIFEHLRTLSEIRPSRRIPHLYMNLINGGKHAKNNLAFQEYHIVSNTESVKDEIDMGLKIQNSLKEIIGNDLGENSLILGDEGGYAPQISNIKKPLEYLREAIKINNFENKLRLALDVASSSFFDGNFYDVDGKKITKEELAEIYNSLIKEFDLLSIEDPFDEEDFESFEKLKEDNDGLIVVGDDLTVTNKILLQEAIEKGSINAMIIKPNQIGTLSETLETMRLARENNIELIISHRSGETDDSFIADLAYAFGCFGLKSGSPIKEERMVKYDRLIEISKKV